MIDFDVPVYAPPFPVGLTQDPEKVRYFAGDSYFLEAYEQLATITADPVGFATRHAMLVIKPDAIVSRSVEPIVDWLREAGFRIVAARRTRITRGGVRTMWHYQLNRATPQRSRLADTIIGSSDSLVLLLRAEDDGTGVPPSVSLTDRKGPADPARREPGQLRARLGNFGFLLNGVHASDEPADIIRELGILFEDSGRRALCTQALADTDRFDEAAALTRQLYAEVPAQDLRFAPAAARLTEAVERLLADVGVVPEAVRGELRAFLGGTTADPVSWGPLVELIWRADLPVIGWDLTIVACSALPMTRPQYAQLLRGADPAHWRQPATAAAR